MRNKVDLGHKNPSTDVSLNSTVFRFTFLFPLTFLPRCYFSTAASSTCHLSPCQGSGFCFSAWYWWQSFYCCRCVRAGMVTDLFTFSQQMVFSQVPEKNVRGEIPWGTPCQLQKPFKGGQREKRDLLKGQEKQPLKWVLDDQTWISKLETIHRRFLLRHKVGSSASVGLKKWGCCTFMAFPEHNFVFSVLGKK